MASSRGNVFVLVPEDRRLVEKRRRRRLFIGAAVVVAVLFLLALRPTARYLRTWHARRLATEGLSLMEAKKWNEASEVILQAYRLDPQEPLVLRSQARLLTQ